MGLCNSTNIEKGVEDAPSAPTATRKTADNDQSKGSDNLVPIFDGWSIDQTKLLGKGAAGKVYWGYHEKEKTEAAVKVCGLHAFEESNEMREVGVWEKLKHPNVVRLFAWKKTNDELYLVTELMKGGELFDAIVERGDEGGYTEKWARGVAIDIVKALAYLHKNGVVHRDLKPENLLLSNEKKFVVKLADFGFADILDKKHKKLHERLGTPGYAAPEILMEKDYGTEIDMWSFGVVLYILLCGYPPFDDEDEEGMDDAIVEGIYEFDEDDWGHVSKDAKHLIKCCMCVDQKQRYTADQALKHKWMTVEMKEGKALSKAATNLKKYIARRRLKKAMNTVRASVKMRMSSLKVRNSSKLKELASIVKEVDEGTTVVSSSGVDLCDA